MPRNTQPLPPAQPPPPRTHVKARSAEPFFPTAPEAAHLIKEATSGRALIRRIVPSTAVRRGKYLSVRDRTAAGGARPHIFVIACERGARPWGRVSRGHRDPAQSKTPRLHGYYGDANIGRRAPLKGRMHASGSHGWAASERAL